MSSSVGKTVLVTGIGGNVGQGVLRNLRHFYPDLRLIGTDIREFTAGHHFCDHFAQVPYCYDEGFGERFANICTDKSVDLVIPTTDYESVYISELSHGLPVILATPPDVGRLFLDKHATHEALAARNIPFAPSVLPRDYSGQWRQTVVKPRQGRGSRDIHINHKTPETFDDSFLVQERLEGDEITTAFYVDRKGELVGTITMRRELAAGMTERCQVVFDHDDAVEPLVGELVRSFAIKGPCNVQSFVTTGGQVVPFEINCRYSGTNSIRSQFGFPDVKWGIQEYLLDEPIEPPTVIGGVAVRIFMDIIYREQPPEQIRPGDADSTLF